MPAAVQILWLMTHFYEDCDLSHSLLCLYLPDFDICGQVIFYSCKVFNQVEFMLKFCSKSRWRKRESKSNTLHVSDKTVDVSDIVTLSETFLCNLM